MSQTRRLAAILAADVAGYSRLMGADEEGTLARLNAHRRALVDPKIADAELDAFGGRHCGIALSWRPLMPIWGGSMRHGRLSRGCGC
jgi:hypothetical protein